MKKSKLDLILMIIFIVLAVALNAYIIYHSCLNGQQSTEAAKGVVDVSEEVVNTVDQVQSLQKTIMTLLLLLGSH